MKGKKSLSLLTVFHRKRSHGIKRSYSINSQLLWSYLPVALTIARPGSILCNSSLHLFLRRRAYHAHAPRRLSQSPHLSLSVSGLLVNNTAPAFSSSVHRPSPLIQQLIMDAIDSLGLSATIASAKRSRTERRIPFGTHPRSARQQPRQGSEERRTNARHA